MPEAKLFEEANRQLVICNACRYCEGLCPVFRAIETRREFAKGDVFYLANLCHDCRACYYACMFTPPHEFAVNIPRLLSEARVESYKEWSWPAFWARSFKEPRVAAILAGGAALLVTLLALALIDSSRLFSPHRGPGAFYEIVPYAAMVIPAVLLFVYGIAVWIRGTIQSWQSWSESGEQAESVKGRALGEPLVAAIGAALSLRHLDGGGPGCTYPEERPSAARRVYHSFVFWGFLCDFASTSLAFVYQDFLHILPPYAVTSAPVISGTVGGVLLICGTAGLIYCKWKSDRAPAVDRAYRMDYSFLVLLGLAALTGLLTLLFRATAALGSLLVLHLAVIAALFITAPYGKFVHFLYRSAALVGYYAEQNAPEKI
jgi:citrate/tricarballylate utilization protein